VAGRDGLEAVVAVLGPARLACGWPSDARLTHAVYGT
jgi:hypothetical protein